MKRPNLRLLILAAAAVFAFDNEALAQLTPVTSPLTVSDTVPEFGIGPSLRVAMDKDGDFVVVWQDDGLGTFDILAHRFNSNGAKVGTEFVVNAITAAHQTDPSVAFLPDDSGYFAIVWASANGDSNYSGIRGNVFDANAAPVVQTEVVVNPTETGSQYRPSVAGSDSGFIVAWEHVPLGADNEIRAATLGSNATQIGSEITVAQASHVLSTPNVDANDGGAFVVAWQAGLGVGQSDIFARRFDDTGTALGTEFVVNTTGEPSRPRVQVGGAGEFLVAWNQGPQNMPYFQLFQSSGSSSGAERLAAESPQPPGALPASFLDVALADDGSFVTAYGPGEIAALLFDSGGNVIDSNASNVDTGEFLVRDPKADIKTLGFYPAIATDGQGLYVVAYGDGGNASNNTSVAARLITSGPLSTTTTTLPNPTCGDPDGNGRTTAGEALLALQTAVGFGTCPLCLCDINNSGTVTTADALGMLRAATNLPAALNCPSCP
jgi:hypothetical protein